MKTDKPENVNIRILYWKEIPLQIEVESGGNRVSKQLDNRFQEGVDAIAMFENNYGTDVYLNGFQWGERFSLAGETNNILNDIVNKFNGILRYMDVDIGDEEYLKSNKQDFIEVTKKLDDIRGEDFNKIFPELDESYWISPSGYWN